MAMLRYEFDNLSSDNLKTLIRLALDLISNAAPFPDTRLLISRISKKTSTEEMDHENLQAILISLMKLVLYWDDHKDQNGHFKSVEKSIINEMLRNGDDELLFDQRMGCRP